MGLRHDPSNKDLIIQRTRDGPAGETRIAQGGSISDAEAKELEAAYVSGTVDQRCEHPERQHLGKSADPSRRRAPQRTGDHHRRRRHPTHRTHKLLPVRRSGHGSAVPPKRLIQTLPLRQPHRRDFSRRQVLGLGPMLPMTSDILATAYYTVKYIRHSDILSL